MDNWIYYATYQATDSIIRPLPASFSELFIAPPENAWANDYLGHCLIPHVIIPNVNSIDQSLTLFCQNIGLNGKNNYIRIWSGGFVVPAYVNNTYDVYYR